MPSVSTSLVLARPGTPTSSPWPPDSRVTQRLLDHLLLAEDDAADGGSRGRNRSARRASAASATSRFRGSRLDVLAAT